MWDVLPFCNCHLRLTKSPIFVILFLHIIHFCSFSTSSHRSCSVRKGVLRTLAKFTGKHLCQSLFFNKVADLRPKSLFSPKQVDPSTLKWELSHNGSINLEWKLSRYLFCVYRGSFLSFIWWAYIFLTKTSWIYLPIMIAVITTISLNKRFWSD